LAIGAMILINGYVYNQIETIIMGYFFTAFTLFTSGYCGFGGCSIPQNNNAIDNNVESEANHSIESSSKIDNLSNLNHSLQSTQPVIFEEISSKN
jgi:hypothetical protein